MPHETDDASRLWDMLEAARKIRQFVAHEYGEIIQEKLWRVATVHVTELIALLEPLIPPLPPAVGE
ncbi:MAG: hypothetical protein NTV86_11000 [Planctomycetota bacterium]|nr:hypothetical protein [Planctomycetota bacterium]